MTNKLSISVSQYSDKGRKETNQDFHSTYVPEEPLLSSKGVAVALADGISSSEVSHIASRTAVITFLEDYYCTSEAWSVKTSAQRVLAATNSWLYAQTRHSQYCYDQDRGYVCTFSAMVIKSTTAHIFHVGDARIYYVHDSSLEQLTDDHRLWISQDKSYLSRALGVSPQLEIDYRSVQVKTGDTFLLATYCVYEHVDAHFMADCIKKNQHNLDAAAKTILDTAYEQGSADNLTIQIVRIDDLPMQNASEMYQQFHELPFPSVLDPGKEIDGYRIIRQVYASSRSHVYLALDEETNAQVIIKTPSIEQRGDAAYLERFLMEEWIARRINNVHVLKACEQTRRRNFQYIVTEYIEGQTLTQWMNANPKPNVQAVRDIVQQVAKGLQAFHRMEMLHQDLRPQNIMIDHTGTVKIIDFGSTRVAGIVEMESRIEQQHILGTVQYTAPEYFLGEAGSTRSDIFSLGVIVYQMLSGRLPYGTQVSKARTRAAQNRLKYASVLDDNREIPAWVDDAIKKAVHPNPYQRYSELSEFMYDLSHPNKAFLNRTRLPLMERNPVAFWKTVSLVLALLVVVLLFN